MPINRIAQLNDRTRSAETKRSFETPTLNQSTVADELKSFVNENPGTLLIIGFIAGGILGWLTSRRV